MRASAREFAEFNGLLGSVVEKGLPLPPAIRLMAGIVRDSGLREGLTTVANDLGDGLALPDALARHPEAFPPEYCGLVRAGVDSGRLPEVLRTAQIHHSLRARLRARMGRLLLYLVCGSVVGELVFVMSLYFAGGMADLNRDIAQQLEIKVVPEFVLAVNSAVESGWILPILWPAAIALAAVVYWLLQRWSRLSWLGYALPVWGRIQKSRDLAVFACVLGLKIRSGVQTGDALRSARDAVVNRRFRSRVDQVIGRTEEGDRLSSALYYTPFFPKTFAWGVSLGEENGEVPRSIDTFASLYTAEMERNFELLVEILTPLGILAVGNIALLCALLILTPFYMSMQMLR